MAHHQRSKWPRRGLSALCSLVGAAAFVALDLPLPFLLGPLFVCLAAALAGVPLAGFGQVSDVARAVIGVAIGAAVTPDLVGQLPAIAPSVALIPLYIIVIGLIGVPFFRRVCGYDGVTAWYAAMPGGLQDMVAFGREAGGDARALSLIHATRLLVIIAVAPWVLTGLFGTALDNPPGRSALALPLQDLMLMAVAVVAGWRGGERIGLFGASILGPLILAAAFSLLGLIGSRPPAEAVLAAQFVIGAQVGAGYAGITFAEIRRDVAAGVLYVGLLAVLAVLFAETAVWFGLAGRVEGWLAFAPGGQAEMTILAIAAGAELGYVVSHHLTRVLLVIAGAPVAARLAQRVPRGRR